MTSQIKDFLQQEMQKRNLQLSEFAKLFGLHLPNVSSFFAGNINKISKYDILHILDHWGYEHQKYFVFDNCEYDLILFLKQKICCNAFGKDKEIQNKFGMEQSTFSKLKKYLKGIDGGSMPSDLKIQGYLQKYFGQEVKIFDRINQKEFAN